MGEQVSAGYGGIAQLGEHLPCKQGVRSSNLLTSTHGCSDREAIFENCILQYLFSISFEENQDKPKR